MDLKRKLICKICHEDGKKSKVAYGIMFTIDRGHYCENYDEIFWDEEGFYHDHKDPHKWRAIQCSRGHEWNERTGEPCWCGYPKVKDI